MAFVAWNARGIDNPNTTRALKDSKKQKYLEKLRTKNIFSSSFYVDPRGLAGGLALWWAEGISVTIMRESINFIDTLVSLNGEEPWQCTFIYGPPNTADKQHFWANLQLIRKESSSKWCIIGDVNIVADQSEKDGGNPINNNQAKWFLDFTDAAGMFELPIKEGKFTWSNMRSNSEAIAEKLDKVLISNEWSMAFPKAIGILEAAVASDHNPIIILLEGLRKKEKEINEAWAEIPRGNGRFNLNRNLKNTRLKLQKWSGVKYGKNRQTIEGIKSQLLKLQNLSSSPQIKEETTRLKSELQILWESEEHQNTKFFHATTIQRQRQNAIVKIKNEQGVWIEDEKEISKIFQKHFKELYTKEESIDLNILSNLIPQSITTNINPSLCKAVTEEEIKNAAFDMDALKSPGPDGFSGIFYHTFWETISREVIALVLEFFRTGIFDESINKTNIILIPKTKNPTEVNQFRPISLCNFSLKIITKILATRLKAFLPEIIPAYQSAFVNGRLIYDNIIIVHEAFHAMKKKRRGSDGIMELKIDLEKAYNKNN
ncbi:hypothetical protein GQ457_12G008860 [Hibiscus cannabinus]